MTTEELQDCFKDAESTRSVFEDWKNWTFEKDGRSQYMDMTDYDTQKSFVDVAFGYRVKKVLAKTNVFLNLFNLNGHIETKIVFGLKEVCFRTRFKSLPDLDTIYDILDEHYDRCKDFVR